MQREGEGKGKGEWVVLPPIPPTYIFLSIMYVCILIIFVAGHILRLRRGCPLILQTQPTIDETGRAPPQFRCRQDMVPLLHPRPSILTLVGGISLLHPPAP